MSVTLSNFQGFNLEDYCSFRTNRRAWFDYLDFKPVCLKVFSLQNALNIYGAFYGHLHYGIEQYFYFHAYELSVISGMQI